MEEAVVLYEKIGQIAKITLNRPKALNAMNGELVSTLASRLDDASKDNDVRVIILTGNDIKEDQRLNAHRSAAE